MQVRNIMTTDLVALEQNASVKKAADLMKKFNIGCVLETQNNELTGIITDRDIVMRLIAEGKDPAQNTLGDFMTQSPVTVSPDLDIHMAANIMAEHQIRRLPVIENNQIVGIVSLGDLAVDAAHEAEDVLGDMSKPTR